MASKKTCFVIIGFGPKTDLETGKVIDLDKTFENLIKPAFDELNIDCFRAKDIRHTGIIDVPMYEWIYNADIVVADISTLNPNALYELGVRHALRPNTTIVISENQTKYPFDINHTLITNYEHLGKDIGVSEAKRFKAELIETVKMVLKSPKNDSPVYTYLPKLTPPKFKDKAVETLKTKSKIEPSLSDLIADAEKCKDKGEYKVAADIYNVCMRFEPQNVFLTQRLVLVTYKSQKPTPEKALNAANDILASLSPYETTDTETLGLAGAINKRYFELNRDIQYLDNAIFFYSKGFHIAQDYYNGINYAYLLSLKATIVTNKNEAISYFIQSQQIREQIVKICEALITSKTFKERGDQHWVYQTLAQAQLALGSTADFAKNNKIIIKLSKGDFDLTTFKEQNEKLKEQVASIKRKHKYTYKA